MIEHAVVIAGAGPTGMMLAAELALAGVDVAVVERRATAAVDGVRAGGLHARTIEILDQRGVADRFLRAGTIAQVAAFATIPLDISDFPTRHNYGLALWQDRIEAILAAWVAELPVVAYRGVEVVGVRQDDAAVTIDLSDGRTMRAAYLVGCDGGRSRVRQAVGIEFAGWDASTSFLLAEATLASPPAWGVRRDARGLHGIGPLDGGARARLVTSEPEVRRGDAPTVDELRAALIDVYGSDLGLGEVTWLSRFTDTTRQAVAYRAGRVLLAGDAAHVHSPAGGQGLNLGMQDAVNLGWKLAQVVRGASPAALLDSYHAERHPVAARVLAHTMASTATNRGDARTAALHDMLRELLAMDEPRRRYAGLVSGLGIRYDLGAGPPLLGSRVPDLDLDAAGRATRVFALLHAARPVLLELDGPPLALGPWAARVDHVRARAVGPWALPVIGAIAAPTAVLIRPDGHAAWVGDGSDAGLPDALTAWCGPAA